MNLITFIIVTISLQIIFILLDLTERMASGKERYGGQVLLPRTVFFILGVVLFYMAIQSQLFQLMPAPYALFDYFKTWFEPLFAARSTGETLSGGWLAIVVILTFFISGLYDYLIHRFLSHSKPLWWSHEYHHLPGQVFNLMPGLVARPFAVILVYPNIIAMVPTVYLLLYIFQLPLYDIKPIIVVFLLQALTNMITHSSFTRRHWIFHRVMRPLGLTTPQEHVIHHAVGYRGNYANLFTFWDRLFNTYIDPEKIEIDKLKLGLPYDADYLSAVTIGKFKLSPEIRKKFQLERYLNFYSEPEKQNQAPQP